MESRKIAVLGATGSIGTQTLGAVRECLPGTRIEALSAGGNVDALLPLVKEFRPRMVCVASERDAAKLSGLGCEVFSGDAGLCELAGKCGADVVVNALVGRVGLAPTLAAIRAGKDVALANKETLVSAGGLVMALAKENGVRITPIDSEHSAISQCMQGERAEDVEKIILTASGGPFREWDEPRIRAATKADALKHPSWKMGSKITVDSATLMNKGLELIEAMWLFDMEPDEIEIVVHPQSIVHSMVQFVDGSVSAVMGLPDMRLPIIYALSGPSRCKTPYPRASFWEIGELSFRKPDAAKFPCLRLAMEAARIGGIHPAVMNSVNEWAVGKFLDGEIGFYGISDAVEGALAKAPRREAGSIGDIAWAEQFAQEYAQGLRGLKKG